MSKHKSELAQYVLLPARGLRATVASQDALFRSLEAEIGTARVAHVGVSPMPRPKLRVLDSIQEDKAKLVEMAPGDMMAMRVQHPGVRIVPVDFYQTAVAPRAHVDQPAKKAATVAIRIKLTFLSAADDKPIAGAHVVAFTDFDAREGDEGTTNAHGEVAFTLGGSSVKVQRLYVYPARGFWGLLKKNVVLTSGKSFKLRPLTFPFLDSLAHFYGAAQANDGAGVRVGVIDTGCGPHADLLVAGGENTVLGEASTDFVDNGDGHGTHVAGIIAAHGAVPSGRSGVAPGVAVMSYRVFGKGARNATNFAIAKAVDRAVDASCDLINMSLGGGPPNAAITSAIADAREQGTAVIVASGNDDRNPVAFPASDPRAVAVSAMGRKGTFPGVSTEAGDIARPFGDDKKNFLAAFSNVGPETALTSTGVGIVSCVPGGYAVMSGTSMACPAVTGFTARVLAARPDILAMAHDQARSDAIVQLVFAAAKSLGFGLNFEGRGLPS